MSLPLAMEIKTKVNKWGLIKVKNFCRAKEIKVKRQPSVHFFFFFKSSPVFWRQTVNWRVEMGGNQRGEKILSAEPSHE